MTNRVIEAEEIGAELGTEGVGSVVSKVEAYCAHEEQRIALANEPRIVSLRAEASWLLDEERGLVERLRLAPPPGDLRSRRRKAFYFGCLTAFLTIAAFVFSLYSFEPFRIGLKAYLYCLGIAAVTPFLVDQLIELWKAEALIKALATFACAAALVSLVLLAVLRGDLFIEQIKDSSSAIVIDDGPPQASAQPNTFYERTTPILQLVMALLALAMELGAGLALHEAWRLGSDTKEDWDRLRKRLAEIRSRLAALAFEITTLQRESSVFAARFWRNFYRAMLTNTVRSAMTKLLIAVLAVLFIIQGYASAQTHTAIVVAVDLTQSENVRGPDGKTEFQKNVEAVTKLLGEVPADSAVTVIGITDRSFSQPDIVLSATIPADTGYFGERLTVARRELIRVWQTRSKQLQPQYRYTDIIGVLMLAGEIFERHAREGPKILILYSDMRHHTRELDLESPVRVPSVANINYSTKLQDLKLKDVRVRALGVDGSGHTTAYWQSLRQFWADLLHANDAVLDDFSPLRTLRSK